MFTTILYTTEIPFKENVKENNKSIIVKPINNDISLF